MKVNPKLTHGLFAPRKARSPFQPARMKAVCVIALGLAGAVIGNAPAQALQASYPVTSWDAASTIVPAADTASGADLTPAQLRWLLSKLFPSVFPVPVVAPEAARAALIPAQTSPSTGVVPDDSNTGVPAGINLIVHHGDLTITQPGTVIDGLDIRGMVKVEAPNVTIKNSIVRGRPLNGPMALIGNLGGYKNLRIIDTELFPSLPSPDVQGIYGYNFEATRLNIHEVVDGIHLTGGDVKISDSWVHDNLHYEQDPNQGGTPSHDDSIQIQAGSNIRIDGNRLTDAWNSSVQVTQDRGDVSNLTITNNITDGGGCSINLAEKSYGPLRGVVVSDNTFGRNTRVTDCAVIAHSTTKVEMSGNRYTPDDTPVEVHPG